MRHRSEAFWDGVAWAIRIVIVLIHLGFAFPSLIRHNIPLIYPTWKAFDDHVPFWWWGAANVLAAVLLLVLPPKVPWGLISTTYSAFLNYLIGATFAEGAGLTSGSVNYLIYGVLMGTLMARSLWAWMSQVKWFQTWMAGHGR